MTEPLELTFSVACSPEHAFSVWATKATLWWPRRHSWSADPQLTVTFEPQPGGRIYERTPDGVEYDWGQVIDWQPPHRLLYLWHIASDRADATEVEVTFRGGPQATAVTIVHRGWDRLGAKGPIDRQRYAQGWEGVIPHYRQMCLDPAGIVEAQRQGGAG